MASRMASRSRSASVVNFGVRHLPAPISPAELRGASGLQPLLLQLRGQVAQVQDRPGRKGAGPLDGVLELAHVARPVVAHHGAQRLVAQGELGAVLAADAVKKVRRQQRNVLAAVAQRRAAAG